MKNIKSAISIDETFVRATTSEEKDHVVAVFRALGDSVRLSIVRKLVREGRMLHGGEIVTCTSVHACSQPCMSYHFAKLVKAGVVLEQKRGTEKFYVLNETGLRKIGIDITKLVKEGM